MKTPSKRFLEDLPWEDKARENPLYAVMSIEEFADSGPEPSEEQFRVFYSRGQEMVRSWILPWLAESGVQPSMRILEFGCGMGRLVSALAESHDPENIFGVDISPTMIEQARKRVRSGVSLDLVGEDGRLPYPDGHFDRVFSYAVFQHISRRSVVEKAIREIGRVLKPTGRVRLNFGMVFRPPFEKWQRHDTFAFENSYVVYGWTRRLSIPLWQMRLVRSNNWIGIRMGYRQLVQCLKESGIDTYGIVRQPARNDMIWFFGEKSSASLKAEQ